MGLLVVIDKVAIRHVSQVFTIAVSARLGRHNLISDEVRQEGGSSGGWKAHVGGLDGSWQQSKYFVPGSLHRHPGIHNEVDVLVITWQIRPSTTSLFNCDCLFDAWES